MRVRATTFAVVALSCAACDAPGESPYFDRASPVRVIETVPAADATDVAIDSVLEVELGGEIDPQGLDDAFTLVELPAESPVAVLVEYESRVARVTLAAGDLELDTRYRAALGGIRDVRGRPVDPFTWEFTTLAPPAPALVRQLPAPGSTTPGNVVVRAVFSVPLDPGALGASPIRLNGGAVGGQTTYDEPGRTLTFRPNASVDGTITVALDPVTDAYGRTFAPAGWTFDADIALEDEVRPTLPGAVAATETSAGTITLTWELAADDVWPASSLRYDALLTRLAPPVPAGCLDVFEPRTVRAAVYGTGGALSVTGLEGGRWSVVLEAEDGSGRRSQPQPAPEDVVLSIGAPTFAAAIEPLLSERCALSGCHAGSDPPGFVDYTAPREDVIAHQSQAGMPLVTPHCLEQSYLWRKLEPGFEIEGQPMPPASVEASTLSRRERALFRRWIQDEGGL